MKNINYPTIDDMITLVAIVERPRVLQFRSRYARPDEPPKSYRPKQNKYGAYEYEVPFEYAERLLNGEPDKYKLVAPVMIYMDVRQPNGGKLQEEVRAWAPRLKTVGKGAEKKEIVVTDSNGIPVYEELPKTGDSE